MILVDTSIWVDHLRAGDVTVADLLRDRDVLMHPFVIGELAIGNLSPREIVLSRLRALPAATVATDAEVLDFINRHRVYGLGIGYVDAHLLVAVQLTPASALWTRDRRLSGIASRLGLAARPLH